MLSCSLKVNYYAITHSTPKPSPHDYSMMSADEVSVAEMSLDIMTVDEMSRQNGCRFALYKMTVDEMSRQNVCR